MKKKILIAVLPFLLMTGVGLAEVFQVGGTVTPQVPSSVYLGETVDLEDSLTTSLTCVDEPTWVRELYTMCAVKFPNGTVAWSEGPTLTCDTQTYTCSHTQTFDEEGDWKFGLAWGYINKTWDGRQWNVEKGIAETHAYTIHAEGAPQTTPEDLQELFMLFLSFL